MSAETQDISGYSGMRECIPTRLLISAMMFMACWMAYLSRLLLPINLVPMVAAKNGSTVTGYCNSESTEDSRSRRAIWYDPENIYEHWIYENGDQEPVQLDSNSLNSFKGSERNLIQSLTKLNGIRQKRDAELSDRASIIDDSFSLFSKKTFHWNAHIQSQILASYGYGSAPGNLVGGIVSIKWGPKRCLLCSTLVAAVLALITPILAQMHWGVLCFSRVLVGFAGGMTFPACHTMVSRWAPPDERSRFVWALLGGTFGMILSYPTVSAIAETTSWQTAWYIPSLVMFVFTACWALIVYDTPAEHPGITDKEKEYIIGSQRGLAEGKLSLAQVPVKRILTSVPFISLVVWHFGDMFLLFFYQNSMMQYLTKSLGFKLTKGGALASLPWGCRMFFGFFFSWIGDTIKRRQYISVTWLRKITAIFSHLIPGLMLIVVSYAGCDFVLANLFLTLSLGFNGACVIGNLSNNQDLSPNFAGFLYGIMNLVACTAGFIGPPIVAAIVGDEDSIENWQKVFWVGASVCIVSMVVFFIGGSGQVQPWNEIQKPENSTAQGTNAPGRTAAAAPAPAV